MRMRMKTLSRLWRRVISYEWRKNRKNRKLHPPVDPE